MMVSVRGLKMEHRANRLTDTGILVPLTTSLYVPGTLADREKVIVDVGTGFYVEKVWLGYPNSISWRMTDLLS